MVRIMCDLLGMSFNMPVSSKITLDLFQKRGSENPDGWGIAFYHEGLLQVVKEAGSAPNSVLFDFMEQYHQSRTIITHVRRSTRGGRSYLNTHPFYRSLVHGSVRYEYAFAHNGTLTTQHEIEPGGFEPLGETDSEQAFCYVLETMARRGLSDWNENEFHVMAGLLGRLNEGENTLNCIFSDGQRLFCYSDRNDHNNGLRFTRQSYPYKTVDLVSPEEKLGRIDIRSASTKKQQTGYIISTRILDSETWTEFERGELIVFEQGEIVYPSTRASV